MTSPANATLEPSSFRLRTFGRLALLGAGGETIVGEHGPQRRRLALLAVLAAAGERGRPRDQLLLLFWPDASQSRARHSLEQLVYAIRNSVGEGVFAGINPLRLDARVVRSDVADFNDALASGELEKAAQQYTGPFLDGVHLSDAPEFEQWMDAERARLERSYAGTLEQIARRAEAVGDHAGAVRWWRKLADADPLSSAAASGLMGALMSVGDHVGALRQAEQYERVVAQELGGSVGPEIAGFMADLRARAKSQVAVLAHPAPPPAATTATESTRSPDVPSSSAAAAEPREEPPGGRRRVSARFAMAGIAILALAVSAALLQRNQSGRGGASASATKLDEEPSIAVLPLANLSANPQDAALVDGLAEELTGALARIERLRVIARTSTFAFRNSELDVRLIADSLRVAFVLEGSVQKLDERLRVQVRLVDGRDGSTRWSQSYDRELRDIFLVQSDIASAVARELDLRLGARAVDELQRGPTQNIAAYELYLRGRDPVHFRTVGGTLKGLAYLEQAVELDSTFAAAYAHMAYMYSVTSWRTDLTRTRELRRLAETAARKAIALDPRSPEAHAAVGITHLVGLTDLRAAESAFNRAVALGGYSRAREHLANVYLYTGRPAEGLAEGLRALREDPLSPTAAADVGRSLCLTGRYQEGLAQLSKVAAVRPPLQRTALYEGLCYAMQGKWSEAIVRFRRTPDPPTSSFLAYSLARAGQLPEAQRIRSNLLDRRQRDGRGAFDLAVVAAGMGDYDQVFAWLDRSIDDLSIRGEIMYPLFAELHADPRFERLRRRLGIQNR